MKQLLAVFCCFLYMHSISHAPFDVFINAQKTSGEKVLIKALAVFVNREGNKKAPVKKISLPSSESPWI
ncbi:MAG TPA: hypothetical protein VIZ28_07685 [Chitinophagaceae bacterium]